jgi:putative membrane protein
MRLFRDGLLIPRSGAAMLTDAILAILHHLLVFAIAIVLTMEIMVTRRDMGTARVTYLSRLDIAFGALAAGILVVGIGRVLWGLKGAEYYVVNEFFWAKMAAFAGVGLLSIRPTLAILRWRGAARGDPAFRPPGDEVMGVRRFMHAEAMLFTLIPIFAALMARYGS